MRNKLPGLTSEQAQKNLQEWGYNQIEDTNSVSPFKLILRQVKKNFILYLLFVSAVVSFFVGEPYSGYAIFFVIFMIVTISFVQEYKAEKAIQELRKMLNPTSIVIRNGREKEIDSREIVPEDILILRTGEKIPADGTILYQNNLMVNESVLTGESREVQKTAANGEKASDESMVFAGSFIVNGRATVKVQHTGMNTRFGKIVGLISESEKELPLQIKVNAIARYVVIIGLILATITGALLFSRIEVMNLENISAILIFLIALSVSIFPEALPVVLMTSLATGAHRMAQKNAIVNRMSIIETLGETTVICSDKTGTITAGEMSVKKIYVDQTHYTVEGVGYEKDGEVQHPHGREGIKKDHALNMLLTCAVLCNDAKVEEDDVDTTEYKIIGTPTEAALIVLGARAGLHSEDIEHEREEEIPFNSSRKMMSVLVSVDDKRFVFAKGAPEVLLKHCNSVQVKNSKKILKASDKEEILATNQKLNESAYRTLALAYKPAPKSGTKYSEDDLIFLGLVALEDSPREGVKDAIETCRQAGIETKMITGDNKDTAVAIASQIGLTGKVLTGPELEDMTDEELTRTVKGISLFVRVKPEHKVRIVKALKDNGEVVTMTGDGVNDAPALKDAHVGVAMGKNGTDVSRSVADLTLKDDNFVTIVEAIREGRTIFNNIRKFVSYLLSVNFAQITVLLIGVMFGPWLGWQTPLLLALQILFINLVTDDFPAITLGFNKSSKDVMREKPRRNPRILTRPLVTITTITGVIMAVITLTVYYVSFNMLGYDHEVAQSTAFVTLIFLAIMNAFNFRSFRYMVLTRSPFVNPYLFYAALVSVIATIIVLYSPLGIFFETHALGFWQWYIVLVSTLFFTFLVDEIKQINNRHEFIELS